MLVVLLLDVGQTLIVAVRLCTFVNSFTSPKAAAFQMSVEPPSCLMVVAEFCTLRLFSLVNLVEVEVGIGNG